MQPAAFPRARRLNRRAEFLRVYDEGSKIHGRFMTLFARPNSLDTSRLGITATRKVGGAVTRNRARRRIREVFRASSLPPGLDLVVVVRRDVVDAEWTALVADFKSLLGRQRRRLRREPQ
jgi:ribonuclease P protein component